MPLPWLIVLPLAAFGAWFLYTGLHGKLLDTHPLCRKCTFDLYNKPPDSARCPECGSDLNTPNATIIGHRQRRRTPTIFGITSSVVGSTVDLIYHPNPSLAAQTPEIESYWADEVVIKHVPVTKP